MDRKVCRVDGLQNTGTISTNNDGTTAIDKVIDCVAVSPNVELTTAAVELQVIAEQCLFCTDEEFLNVANCHKHRKGN